MRWLRRLEAWARSNPGRVDAIGAILVGLMSVPSSFVLGTDRGTSWAPAGSFVAAVLVSVAVAFRRTRPRWALWLTIAGGLVQVGTTWQHSFVSFVVPLIIYSVTAYGTRTDSRLTVTAAAVASVLGTAMIVTGQQWGSPMEVIVVFIGHILVCAVAIVTGDLTRARRLAMQAVADRAQRLEQEQEQERALAAADERRRIAREMHDVVAHSLSVIIAQADGGRYAAATDPKIAPQTLETIADTGRSALAEMRSLLGVLRSDDEDNAPKAPAPDLSQLPQLVESVKRSGLPATFTQRGEPVRELPNGAELAAFRAAQESLTNVLKHAGPGAEAELDLTWTAHGLTLTVTDTGRGATSTDGRGRGQQGMRERAELYGGSASFGPRPKDPRTGSQRSGGYAVTVFLPYQEI